MGDGPWWPGTHINIISSCFRFVFAWRGAFPAFFILSSIVWAHWWKQFWAFIIWIECVLLYSAKAYCKLFELVRAFTLIPSETCQDASWAEVLLSGEETIGLQVLPKHLVLAMFTHFLSLVRVWVRVELFDCCGPLLFGVEVFLLSFVACWRFWFISLALKTISLQTISKELLGPKAPASLMFAQGFAHHWRTYQYTPDSLKQIPSVVVFWLFVLIAEGFSSRLCDRRSQKHNFTQPLSSAFWLSRSLVLWTSFGPWLGTKMGRVMEVMEYYSY